LASRMAMTALVPVQPVSFSDFPRSTIPSIPRRPHPPTKLRIAQVSPLYESVPPSLYGGTERIVSYLTEELVAQGHEVTLFASGDSLTSARLVPCSQGALRLNPQIGDALPYHVLMLEEILRRIDEFDIVHFHIDFLHFPVVRNFVERTVTT